VNTNTQNTHPEKNDYYNYFRCFTPKPDNGCHVNDDKTRCRHLRIVPIEHTEPQYYHYICEQGCFEFITSLKIH
jgi:hypothetical protein